MTVSDFVLAVWSTLLKCPFTKREEQVTLFFFPYLVWKELPEQGIENTLSL